MATKGNKRHKEWGRRLRSSRKGGRSGPTGKKVKRKTWADFNGKKFPAADVTRGRAARVEKEKRNE